MFEAGKRALLTLDRDRRCARRASLILSDATMALRQLAREFASHSGLRVRCSGWTAGAAPGAAVVFQNFLRNYASGEMTFLVMLGKDTKDVSI